MNAKASRFLPLVLLFLDFNGGMTSFDEGFGRFFEFSSKAFAQTNETEAAKTPSAQSKKNSGKERVLVG